MIDLYWLHTLFLSVIFCTLFVSLVPIRHVINTGTIVVRVATCAYTWASWTCTLDLGYRIVILGTKAQIQINTVTRVTALIWGVFVPCIIETKHFLESITRPRIRKHFPKSKHVREPKTRPGIQKTRSKIQKCFGEVFGFLDVFLVFRTSFWMIRSVSGFSDRSVLDSGKCFWLLERVLDCGKCFFYSGTCFVPTSHRTFVIMARNSGQRNGARAGYLAIWPPNTRRKCMAEIKQNKIEQVLA